MTLFRQGSAGQVLPVARDDGYYMVDPGRISFVPLDRARRRPRGQLILFPFMHSLRATQRADGYGEKI
jgi:hypothetical protein